MSGNNILSLLGLALRGGRLAVGEEPVALAAKAGQARLLLTASDAAGNTLRRAEHLAQEGHCLCLTLPFPKEELGGALGRGSAAIAALTDTGLAAAVTQRLAAQDPDRYGEAAARMDLKRRRAKERQAAPHRAPPEKAPPSGRRDRRPPESRRTDRPERRDRPYPPRDGQGPKGRRDRPPRDGRPAPRPHGGDRHEKPDRSQSGGRRHPGEDGRRPYGEKPREARGRPQGGKSAGRRPQTGKRPGNSRSYKRGGGPRSGGGNSSGGGSPADRGR